VPTDRFSPNRIGGAAPVVVAFFAGGRGGPARGAEMVSPSWPSQAGAPAADLRDDVGDEFFDVTVQLPEEYRTLLDRRQTRAPR
jgi:hypothetical protein